MVGTLLDTVKPIFTTGNRNPIDSSGNNLDRERKETEKRCG